MCITHPGATFVAVLAHMLQYNNVKICFSCPLVNGIFAVVFACCYSCCCCCYVDFAIQRRKISWEQIVKRIWIRCWNYIIGIVNLQSRFSPRCCCSGSVFSVCRFPLAANKCEFNAIGQHAFDWPGSVHLCNGVWIQERGKFRKKTGMCQCTRIKWQNPSDEYTEGARNVQLEIRAFGWLNTGCTLEKSRISVPYIRTVKICVFGGGKNDQILLRTQITFHTAAHWTSGKKSIEKCL